ncbi:hypothetical protein PCANC_07249 [Puccinia coronata f. sp. avenae]|uniref:Uncharacterized protein n=1 Tax=Puccinia coronata f. sp. avenae TaxID=200324 RepID=A0A2N5UY30_9BASI|nr:hypothetical protein PCASD_08473 [Puccinia coronata f. sp. avenae]PLW52771.1 hypothetical protein PCANC_07249 [Puccinia coronata f. sp. avenae]
MKSLIITISAALMMSRVHSHPSYALPSGNQTASLNSSSATTTGLNTAPAGITTLGNEGAAADGGLNSTAAFNATASPATAAAVGTNATALMENSLVPSTNGSAIFYMEKDIQWTKSNFTIYNHNGTAAYTITNQYAAGNLTAKEFIVADAISGEKKLRVDSKVKHCGFGQTYEADDGTTFILDTRAFLPDRWYIKDANSEYTFKRHALSLQGNILENQRIVADVQIVTNVSASATPKKQLSLMTDGSVRTWDLIALLALAKSRIHSCGY